MSKKILKITLFLFGISMLLLNCEKDNLEPTRFKNLKARILLNEQVPEKIKDYIGEETNNSFKVKITKESIILSKDLSKTKDDTKLGVINRNKSVIVENKNNTKYTFSIIPKKYNKNVFINLVVVDLGKGKYIEYFMKYIFKDVDAMPRLASSGALDMSKFDGEITFYNSEGKKYGSQKSSFGRVHSKTGSSNPCPGPTGGGLDNPDDPNDEGGENPDSMGGGSTPCTTIYGQCDCGGNADGHRASGSSCCQGSPMVYTSCRDAQPRSTTTTTEPPCGGDTGVILDDNIVNMLTDKCAKSIFTELENGIFEDDPIKPEVQISVNNTSVLNFHEGILKLFNDSDKTHLIVQNGDIGNSNANTIKSTITIGNNYLANATKLAIARTMIHETLHAYLNAVFFSYPDLQNITFRDKLRRYASENGYSDVNTFHHNFMSQYIDAMAYSLYEWDKEYGTGRGNNNITNPNDLLGWEYYRSMAFGGLFTVDANTGLINSETDSFIALIPVAADRQKIADIIVNEQNSNNNAQGTKCN